MHNFQDTVNPLCSCSHFLLRRPFFSHNRNILLDNLIDIIGDISNLTETKLVNVLLYGNTTYTNETNNIILKNTINYLKKSERFDIPLL